MDKRTFLKTSSALVAGSMFSSLRSCAPASEPVESLASAPRTNWAGNLTYRTNLFHTPGTLEEVQEIVRTAERIRPLGSTHCFNTIADSTFSQISVEGVDIPIEIDADKMQVTVGAGLRYGQLAPYLHERGFAIHNLASLPHISVAGACATATHGSGVQNGNLATAVVAIEFINAAGELVTLSRDQDGDRFAGAVVGLGCLGVVTRVTLEMESTYEMAQHVYLNQPMDQMIEHFDAIMSSEYSVSIFTDWNVQAHNQIWLKKKQAAGPLQDAPAMYYGAQLADRDVHPVLRIAAESCTPQQGVIGPWFERLPHFKMDFTPSSGKELQTEYFFDRSHAADVLEVYLSMAEQLAPILMISEIRTVAQDDLWLSTAYGRETFVVHCTWEQEWDALQALLPELEAALAPYDPRPHWGKNFLMGREELASKYERMDDFRSLAAVYDPSGKFRNDFVNEKIFG